MLSLIKRLLSSRSGAKTQSLPVQDSAHLVPIKLPLVNGVPTWDLAGHKDDLPMMLRCCDAEESAYWAGSAGKRVCAAPFFFARAAVLLKKARDDAGEIAVCERWIAIVDDYAAQDIVRQGIAAQVQRGPHSDSMKLRLEKARVRLAKKTS
jgi:hypothetical protein